MKNIDLLVEMGYEDLVYFSEPEFDEAIIGVSENGECVVYSYEKMVECLIDNEGMGESDARVFIIYNTLRSLPYMSDKAPVVVHDICFKKEEC